MGGESPDAASTPARAVFLSYASQDAEAAQKICDALSAAGIEVWFDKSELRGGDAWDRQIRTQIHECRLFVPIVSANTEARIEGYFRREWKLAVDRTHDLSDRVAFLLPVVIDSTSELKADVPDAFRHVQWTRLPGGETPSAFVNRVQRLLSREASTTVRSAARAMPWGVPAIGQPVRVTWRSKAVLRAIVVTALAVAVLAIGVYAAWRAHFAASLTAMRVEAPAASALPAHTVAVLPFENLSAEPNDGFLATGVAESVLHRLAAVQGLSVIARTSSFTFHGRDVDARDIGRKLNARYLVEGSVQRAGDRLRVTAQLLDASSGSGVWSLRLERHMGDIFELEDEIAGKVTDAVGVSLAAQPGRTSPQGTPKLDAYLAYIEGRSLLSTFKTADVKVGIERLRRATEIDPTFAAAYAEEAHGLRLLWGLLHPNVDDAETEKQATSLVDKALALDPELGEAWVQRANGRGDEGFDAVTDADFRKGLALAPNYAEGYELYGEWLHNIGHTDDGLAMIERARQLDPLAPRNHYMKGRFLAERNDVDAAIPLWLEALRVNPTYHPALARLGEVESARGNFAEAVRLTERAIAVDPMTYWMRVDAAGVYLDLGDTAAAQDVLSAIPPTATIPESVLWKFCLSIYLGETQRAAGELYALPHGKLNATILNKKDMPCPSAVIRDDALERHDYGRGLSALEVCLAPDWDAVLSRPGTDARASCAVQYASLLIASGERDRAAKLLHSMLKGLEHYKPYIDVADAHASALALLGDTDGALKALEAAFAAQKFGWWYELERSPDFKGLHSEARFQSLAKQYQEIVAKQSALVAEMRRSGEVPYRPPSTASPR